MQQPKRARSSYEEQSFLIDHAARTGVFNMVQNHAHDSYEIYYLKGGARYYFIKDRSYLVREGDLVLIEPMVLHRTSIAYSGGHERILINFQPSWLQRLMTELPAEALAVFRDYPIVRPEPKDKLWIDTLIGRMLGEHTQGEPGSDSMVKLLLSELLVWLYRYAKEHEPDTSAAAEHPTTLHRKVSDIVRYINERYEEELTLQTIAERFHISSYYLCRIFKEATGFTLVEYIQRLRVREAQRLLATTRLSMTELAGRVGFDSSTHFGRVFKTVSGLSPLQYRKSVAAGHAAAPQR